MPNESYIALADGAVFRGISFGAPVDALGEAVFNTGMTGYQEILTDPSYAGQFMVLTVPEVGNYGLNDDDDESRGMFLSGLVVRRANEPSNWRARRSLADGLRAAGKPALHCVDTRALAIHLRDHGSQKAFLHASPEPLDPAEAIARARAWEGLDGQDYAAKVSCEAAYDFGGPQCGDGNGQPRQSGDDGSDLSESCAADSGKNGAPLVAVYDFGVKRNILRSLSAFARVRVVPAKTPAEEVLAMNPDGVFLSNGPADPAALPYAIANIRKILGLAPLEVACGKPQVAGHPDVSGACDSMECGSRPPVMGICLGHQLLALACGAKTGRLPFGHHGCNHPVQEVATGRVQITSQNHNFTVIPETMPSCLEITHVNLNDGSVEGLRHKTLPAFSVQYHPEAAPGPHDAAELFARFAAAMHRGGAAAAGA